MSTIFQICSSRCNMASHRAQMHKSAIEAARYGVGISLLPGPPIPPDGDCLFAASIAQVGSFLSANWV